MLDFIPALVDRKDHGLRLAFEGCPETARNPGADTVGRRYQVRKAATDLPGRPTLVVLGVDEGSVETARVRYRYASIGRASYSVGIAAWWRRLDGAVEVTP